jgi:hypothetical protein
MNGETTKSRELVALLRSKNDSLATAAAESIEAAEREAVRSRHGVPCPAVLREPDAARYICLSRAFLKKSRLIGDGPDFVRLNRTIVYRLVDLDRWLESHVVRQQQRG